MPEFEKQWKSIGFDDNDLLRLQDALLANPSVGSVIRGTGGLRKMRFAFEGKGKSGSSRVLYVDFLLEEQIFLITVYAKSSQDNLTDAQRNALGDLVGILKSKLRGE